MRSRRNGRSKGALWKTSGRSAQAARSRPAIAAGSGASATIASVMPWTRTASGGIGRPGRTRLDHSAPIAPFSSTTLATSTSAAPSAGLMPVVSVSSATSRVPFSSPTRALRADRTRGRALLELLPAHAAPDVVLADVAEHELEAVGGDVARHVRDVLQVGPQEDRGRIAAHAELLRERARGKGAPPVAGLVRGLRVEPDQDEVLVQVAAHVVPGVDLAIHALAPSAPVRIHVDQDRAFGDGRLRNPLVPV